MAAGESGAARGRRGEGGGLGMRRLVLIDLDTRYAGRPELWRIVGTAGLVLMAAVLLVLQQRSVRREARQKRLVQLGMAARTLTHEIRNPLGVLKAQEALLRKTLPPEFAADVSVIGEEIDRLKTITDRVRDWLSDPRGNPVIIDVASELERILGRLPWPVTRDYSSLRGKVLMDPVLFASAVENLVRNAVESSDGMDECPVPTVSCRTRGRRIRIVVEDRGRGLPDVRSASLFDPFFTTKARGSGVGLALSRQLVEAAGGSLTLAGREGGGARAVIELPEERD
jgi:two-component system sensor histidine kinase HydH